MSSLLRRNAYGMNLIPYTLIQFYMAMPFHASSIPLYQLPRFFSPKIFFPWCVEHDMSNKLFLIHFTQNLINSSFIILCNLHRLFKRAISFVGKDYSCHSLWDKYIEFEFSQQCWSSLAQIFIQTLRFPTKKLHHYYRRYYVRVASADELYEQENLLALDLKMGFSLEHGCSNL